MRVPLPAALALLLLVPATAVAQDAPARHPTPISRQDLTRMLRGGTYTRAEIAGMIRRACVSFVPTATERELYRGLGADGAVLAAIDACLSPPAPAQALPSELPPPAAAPTANFASVRPPDEADREAGGESRPAPGLPDSAAPEPAVRRGPAGDPRSDPAIKTRSEQPVETDAHAEDLIEADPHAEEPAPEPPPAPSPIVVGSPAQLQIPAETGDSIAPAGESESRVPEPLSETRPDVEASDTDVGRLRRLAAEAIARRDIETAVRMRLEIVSLAPEDPVAWFELGESLASVGDREGAREAFIRASRLDRAQRRLQP